ncbi:MAG: type IV pili twitching motility protein PilT, partial [Cyanobacteriota bacterium]|nr:type IV pili twitching motility protein PilT [Cyanobacteriota bacterium]
MAGPDTLFPPSPFPPAGGVAAAPPLPPLPVQPSAAAAVPPAPPSPAAMPPSAAGANGQPRTLEEIVRIAHQQAYSDIHLGVGEEPRFRARGEMQGTGWPVTDLATFNGWLR